MDNVWERANRVLAKQFHIPVERVTESAALDGDLGATSLDLVEVVMSLEDEFSIEISDSEAARFSTVGDIMACVASKAGREMPNHLL